MLTLTTFMSLNLQVVDMRWGVRDEATDDHMTSELCMKEIKECQRLSTGPNFVVSQLSVKYLLDMFRENYKPFLYNKTHISNREYLTNCLVYYRVLIAYSLILK